MIQTKTVYHQELQEQVRQLKDGFDIKSVENELLKNELTEVEKPNIILGELSKYVLEMLSELSEYEQKNKLNDRMKASKARLVKMFDLTTQLSGLGDKNRSLKLFNRELFGIIQMLRIDNSKLRKDNETMQKAFEGL